MKITALTAKTILIIFLILPFSGFSENPVSPAKSSKTISGIIVDNQTQEQLGGVYLYFEDLQKGVYSGPDGKFNLDGIAPGQYKVTVKYISYHERKLTIKVKKSRKSHKIIGLDPINP